MKRKSIILLIVLTFVMIAATQCSPAATTAPALTTVSSSTLDGKSLVETQCSTCHNLDRVQSAHKDTAAWKTTVERMVGKGAKLTADEQMAVIEYLAKTYP